MKGLLVILVILVVVFVVVTLTGEDAEQAASAPAPENLPIWRQPIPPGTRLVDSADVDLNIEATRRDKGTQTLLEFRITEEHGYMVDGIRLNFWYRFQDDETGEWIDDPNEVEHFIKTRLGFNETLVDSTPLLDVEFRHLGSDLATSTTKDWGVRLVSIVRAMEPAN